MKKGDYLEPVSKNAILYVKEHGQARQLIVENLPTHLIAVQFNDGLYNLFSIRDWKVSREAKVKEILRKVDQVIS